MRRKVYVVDSVPRIPEHVVGLDLSLRGSAACAIPLDWNGSPAFLRTAVEGYPLTRQSTPREKAERLEQLVEFVRLFVLNARAKRVFVEEYAFHAPGGSLADLGELCGSVKHTLFTDHEIVIEPIVASSARKTLLQRVPRLARGKTKPFVVRNVKRIGGQSKGWTDDECDAFVIANHGLMLTDGVPISFPGE